MRVEIRSVQERRPEKQDPERGETVITWEEYWKTENRFAARRSGQGVPMECVVPGRYRQLFVDNTVIEHVDNLHKTLHQPVRDPANPVLTSDRPWEDDIGYCSVILDQADGLFKAWYILDSGLAYATSPDGVRWDKPDLGLIEYEGSRSNNLVLEWMRSPTVFKDPDDPDDDRRYKLFAMRPRPRYGIYVGFSPDGLHWRVREEPVLTTDDDPGLNDHPTAMHDRLRNRYIGFPKTERINPMANGDWGFIQRMRSVSFSEDFETWTDPVVTLRADDCDPPGFQVHGLSGFTYENAYLGFVDAMHSEDVGPMERTMDIQLACSRDGELWWRAGNRETFVPRGEPGAFDACLVLPCHTPPIREGEELYIYYSGSATRHRRGRFPDHRRREPWCGPGHPELESEVRPHGPRGTQGDGAPSSGMGLARLRVDGFVSMDAGSRPGRLLTRPLQFEGEKLHVNADAAGGYVKAELFRAVPVDLAANHWTNSPAWNWAIEEPIPGFGLEDCIGISKDTTDGVLAWKGGDSIAELAGEKVVIRFELCNAGLYSFWLG